MLDVYAMKLLISLVYLVSFLVMYVLKKKYNVQISGYNLFIWFFIVSFVSVVFALIYYYNEIGWFYSLSLVLTMLASFLLVKGFYDFLELDFYYIVYAMFLLAIVIFIHVNMIFHLMINFTVFLVLLHGTILHLALIYRMHKLHKETGYNNKNILFYTNIAYASKGIIFIAVLGMQRHTLTPESSYELMRIMLNSAMTVFLMLVIITTFLEELFDNLKNTNDRMQRAQETSVSASWEIDLLEQKFWGSKVAFKIYELDLTEDQYLDVLLVQSMVDSKDRLKMDLALTNLIEHNIPYDVTFTLHAAKGTKKYIKSVARLVKNKDVPIRVVGTIIDITELHSKQEQLMYLSYHDSLTGVYNRRYYEEYLESLMVEENMPLSIIVADINGLKLMNDAFGHKQGDKLIVQSAKIFKENLGDNTTICRIGGDEFILFLPNHTQLDSEHIMAQIHADCKKYKISSIPLSISLGDATLYSSQESYSEAFKRAEDAMYRMKLLNVPTMRSNTIDAILETLYEKDLYAETHSKGVSMYGAFFAKKMGLPEDQVNQVKMAGLLHDIGKISIPTNILNKTVPLSLDEFEEIKKHPEIGYRILNSSMELRQFSDIVLYHHEKHDGTGYPYGRSGETIPLLARILSLADVFDAITSDRTYRRAMSIEFAKEEINRSSGSQFDPKIVALFNDCYDDLVEKIQKEKHEKVLK
jgi:diguanylate cyclase (GGDEF)-like protein/putative nucleotidyltransferase with HDIG domain